MALNGMKFHSYHGCFDFEKELGNDFILDLDCEVDFSAAVKSDALEDTVNYGELYAVIKEEMAAPSNLIENVLGRIISRIKEEFPAVYSAELTISKMNPPVGGQVDSASVSMKFDRNDE